MSLLPFGTLAPHKPRRFVPAVIDLGDWPRVEPLFDALAARIRGARTAPDLEAWLHEWSELSAALDEESSKRYIAMTCHTDHVEAERAYLHFIEAIEPKLKPRQFELERLYLDHPERHRLPEGRFQVFDRHVAAHVELYREENIPLETEESRLGQQYQKLAGSLSVQFQGRELTVVQMAKYLEEPDRTLREQAWKLTVERRLREADTFEDQFEEMLRLRERIAANAGFANYRDYAFRLRTRFDYSPQDCTRFHESVEREWMPVVRQLQARRREELGLEVLRPWDLAVDTLGRPPLRPFENATQLVDRTQAVFDHLDPRLAQSFRRLHELRLLDLTNRKGKAPGGYQSTLAEARLPFIFMNAVGLQRDVETILHEAGHAFHAMATHDQDFYPYRSAPIEFCEVASMSMELLGAEFLGAFYADAEARRARRDHLEGVVEIFPWIATVDAFQHWIYTHPGHSRAQRQAAWVDLMTRFGGDVDWSGYESARAQLWHRQLHIFIHPFYYIEYGIAQIGALQVWANSKRDRTAAINAYLDALALGGSRPLPELFQAAGCALDFSAEAMRPLLRTVTRELATME